jgi:uncharacterized protein (DUF924 family)
MNYMKVLEFWFDEGNQEFWFKKSLEFDGVIKERFGEVHENACSVGLSEWRDCGKGRLAEIVVLDQFSRNLFRDDKKAFACDELALELAQDAIGLSLDLELNVRERQFLYMPFMLS